MTFKPMLAGKAPADLSTLTYPVLASVKLDGIRCVMQDGKALSRSLKTIPNDHIRAKLEATLPDGIDGELLLRDWTRPFKEVSSAVMSKSGEPNFTFAAFDILTTDGPSVPFELRAATLEWVVGERTRRGASWLLRVRQVKIVNATELMHYMADSLESGYEGVMVRSMNGPYKHGRSTTREGYLLKIKNFVDEEAEVVGIVEQMHNANEATVDNLGHTKRSTHKANKIGNGVMGALICKFADGTVFNVGTGFDDKMREEIWEAYDHGLNYMPDPCMQVVKVKHQPDPGGRQPGQAPRIPVFLGFRHKDD